MVILDVTGESMIDTQVARALLRAADAGKLLGAQTILVGIRPKLAQTIVGLRLSLTNLVTQADLQSGMAYATQHLQSDHQSRPIQGSGGASELSQFWHQDGENGVADLSM